jgi:type I restriction enzyme M protein
MPRKPRAAAAKPALTTAQALGSLLKSARDIMRKDKGLNGDLDRLPLLTWIMFLKFLDDLEQQREQEAALAGTRFRPAIEPPYRWRDWAANPQGITGDELLSFINNDEGVRPDGTSGPGLFAYLRGLTSANGDDRRDVIATVFRGVDNRMRSGYLLRDVIDKIGAIHFTSSEELHTLGALYESMLREMRDAAGDSGEFYTPRAVVRLMVQVTDPRLGETVLDPAAGTGGFLVEAFAHLAGQVQTVADRRVLQSASLMGCEPKSLPYLLCQMNLLLHGLDAPRIDPGNALRHRLTEIGERDRVDVILTNPPFGGEEERGIQGNFPEDRQAAETALLFLQLIMRRLKRAQSSAGRPARAAVVVPNGTLFGDGVCARIKADMLEQFNLHTVLRLPEGVFAPYTDIPTNVIFFDTAGPTRDVWFYEQPTPEGRRKYSKTRPIQFEEFADCLTWWGQREEGPQAWKVNGPELVRRDEAGRVAAVNLDLKNPSAKEAVDHRAPSEIVASVIEKERQVLALLDEIRALVAERVA